jgi:hypothetical protein
MISDSMSIMRSFMAAAQGICRRPAILFLFWSLWLAAEYIGLGPLSYVWVIDNGDSNLPARIAAAIAFQNGDFGLWCPVGGAGADRMAMGYQNKTDLLFFFALPGWLAYGLITGLQRFVAGYFTFRLLRDSLQCNLLPSLFGGLFYSLFCQPSNNHQWSGFTLYDGLALPALPFLLWALGRLKDETGWKDHCVAGLLGLGYALASHFFYTVFIIPVVIAWFLFVQRRSWSFHRLLVTFVIAWVLGESPFIWASLSNAPLSQRKNWSAAASLVWNGGSAWLEAAVLSLALFRDNFVPLALAAAGIALPSRRDRRLIILTWGVVLCFVYVICHDVFLGVLIDKLGLVPGGFSLRRIYILLPFLSAVAGAVGLSHILHSWEITLSKGEDRRVVLSLQTGLCLTLIGLVGWQSLMIKGKTLEGILNGESYQIIYQNPSLLDLRKQQERNNPFRVATVYGDRLTGPHPAVAWAYGLESADGYIPLYSERYHAFWARVIAPLRAHDREAFDRFLKGGHLIYLYAPKNNASGGDSFPPDRYCNLDLLSLANVRFILSRAPLENPSLKLVSGNRVESQLLWADRPRRERFLGMLRGEYPGIPMYVYENEGAFPRFFLTSRVRSFDNPEQLLDALGHASRQELLTTAHVLDADFGESPIPSAQGRLGQVLPVEITSDRLVLEVRSEADAVLVVTNNYSPYWKARVDGVEARLFPVDHTFQGVLVGQGVHRVMLSYEPPYSWVSILMALKGDSGRKDVRTELPGSRHTRQDSGRRPDTD